MKKSLHGATTRIPSITMVTGHCCIRVHKMAMPLCQKGYKVNLITNSYPGGFEQYYDSVQMYASHDHLRTAIKAIDPLTDIYHCHNEPNWFVSAVKEISKKPVILDFHDSFLLRKKRDSKDLYRIITEERNNAFLADGFNFPCEPMKREVFREFKAVSDKPSAVLWSYVPIRFYRWDFFEWLGGITYQGRVDHPSIKDDKKYNFFTYCEYTDLAINLRKRKIPFWLYSPKDKIIKWYQKRNFIAGGGTYAYDNLIQALGRHDWGLIGNVDSHREWENAMPNKLFEYIAAQVPVVALNSGHAGKWIEKEKIGINIKTLDELEERWGEHEELRVNLTKRRLDYCMEEHIWKLEELYEEVMGVG